MGGLLERFARRREYRLASIALIAGCLLCVYLPLAITVTWGWAGLAFAIAMLFYVTLFVLTYFRLRNASLSTLWLLFMIVVFPIGPRWELGAWDWGEIAFAPSGFISLIPVIMGWFAPEAPMGVRRK